MCLSYERLMSLGFCHAMVPIMKKLYGDDKEELSKGLTRHSPSSTQRISLEL